MTTPFCGNGPCMNDSAGLYRKDAYSPAIELCGPRQAKLGYPLADDCPHAPFGNEDPLGGLREPGPGCTPSARRWNCGKPTKPKMGRPGRPVVITDTETDKVLPFDSAVLAANHIGASSRRVCESARKGCLLMRRWRVRYPEVQL